MLSALVLTRSVPFASLSSPSACVSLNRSLPARTTTSSASPHTSFTAGHAVTLTLFTVPYFSTFPRTTFAANLGPSSCASTSTTATAATAPAAILTARPRPLAALLSTLPASHFARPRARPFARVY